MGSFHLRLSFFLISCLFTASWLFDVSLFGAKSTFDEIPTPASLDERSEAILTSSEPSTSLEKNITVGKLSMHYGTTNPLYGRALDLQEAHNKKFGYPMFTLHEQTLPGYWSKPGHILQVLLAELAKPANERLSWLFWVDADIVLMNPNIPLEIFLPPSTSSFAHINLIATSDHRGLNNGAFFLRVCPWSVNLFTTILSLPIYQPDLQLKFGDQSAMAHVLSPDASVSTQFLNSTVYVPQRWFNAYAGYRGRNNHDPFSRPKKFTQNAVLEGDLQVHLAGGKTRREEFMTPFLDASEMHTERWEIPLDKTGYVKDREIEKFWEKEAARQLKARDAARGTMKPVIRKAR